MNTYEHARLEELLDWLADAVATRLRAGNPPAQRGATGSAPTTGRGPEEAAHDAAAVGPAEATEPVSRVQQSGLPRLTSPGAPRRLPSDTALSSTRAAPVSLRDESGSAGSGGVGAHAAAGDIGAARPPAEEPAPAAAAPPSHAARLMGRLAVGLLAAVLLINIPLGLHGTAIARMIPSSTTLVIRDGLLVKESDSSDVYVYQDGAFHWITDIYVFNRHFYRWQDVHEVEPGFLEDYTLGRPIYLLAMCPSSPHIYRLQDGTKRWIVDIATFEAEGYEWADVQTMSCSELRAMPDGETIPPGHGPAPQP